jgi:hypothetical protein
MRPSGAGHWASFGSTPCCCLGSPGTHKEERSSFLKKRTKKLLSMGLAAHQKSDKEIKVFCFFFSKKKALLANGARRSATEARARSTRHC